MESEGTLPLLVPVLSKLNSVHAFQSCFLKNDLKIILTSVFQMVSSLQDLHLKLWIYFASRWWHNKNRNVFFYLYYSEEQSPSW